MKRFVRILNYSFYLEDILTMCFGHAGLAGSEVLVIELKDVSKHITIFTNAKYYFDKLCELLEVNDITFQEQS